jgi:hypothetical protein
MAVDLYSMLMGYAKKSKSPYVVIDEFQVFIKQYAEHFGSGMNEWSLWAKDTDAKFKEEIASFVAAGTCEIQIRRKIRYVYLPQCAIALIQSAWNEAIEPGQDFETRAMPFPNELSCDFSLPEASLLVIKVANLVAHLEKIREEQTSDDVPKAIIKLEFPGELGSILFPATALDSELLCAALFRIRYYLLKNGNQEFVQQKLSIDFSGREEYPRDILNKLSKMPRAMIADIAEGGDGSYLLWQLCCELIRDDTSGKNSLSADDVVISQALSIIEQYNILYNKIRKMRKYKKEALDDLLLCFDQAPFIFNLGQVINFKDANQVPLLSRYSEKELDTWLKTITTPVSGGEVPLLIAVTDKSNERWFVRKERVHSVCLRLLLYAQDLIRNAIIEQWEAILEQCQRDPAMDSDQAFETLLTRLLTSLIPPLAAMLRYRLLPLLAVGEPHSAESQREFAKLFSSNTGKLLNISAILFLRREALVKEALARLPFWHSVPILVKLVAFVQNLRKKLEPAAPEVSNTDNEAPLTFLSVYKKFETELVPQGYTLDWYLVHLYQMWAKLLYESDRRNLLQDVNYLLRGYVRRHFALIRPEQVDEYFLEESAVNFIEGVPALQHLHDNSLTLYVKLYIIKTLRKTHHHE